MIVTFYLFSFNFLLFRLILNSDALSNVWRALHQRIWEGLKFKGASWVLKQEQTKFSNYNIWTYFGFIPVREKDDVFMYGYPLLLN